MKDLPAFPGREFPRRFYADQQTPAEQAISDAMAAVEKAGADVRLTDAVTLLGAAKDAVADYVDGVDVRRYVRTCDDLNGTALQLTALTNQVNALADVVANRTERLRVAEAATTAAQAEATRQTELRRLADADVREVMNQRDRLLAKAADAARADAKCECRPA